jgi:hypothetical protein
VFDFTLEYTRPAGLGTYLLGGGAGTVLNNTRGYWKVKFPSPPPYILLVNMSHCLKGCQHILIPRQLFSVANTGLMRNLTGTWLRSGSISATVFSRAALTYKKHRNNATLCWAPSVLTAASISGVGISGIRRRKGSKGFGETCANRAKLEPTELARCLKSVR